MRIQKEIEDSLARLRTDVIDIYQVHWPDPNVPIEETAAAMADLQRAGRFDHRRQQFQSRADRSVSQSCACPDRAIALQSVRARDRTGRPLLPGQKDRHVAYGSLCRGLLSGRMTSRTRFIGDDLRKTDPKFQGPRFAQYLRAVEMLDRFAQANYGRRVIHLALRWVLDRQDLMIALWGARRPDQLSPIGGLAGWHIDSSAIAEIDRILSETIIDPVGPEFMAPPVQLAA